MQNIYLIGMMGAGKTTTAFALTGLLNKKNPSIQFVDIDKEIQYREKLSINDIFQKKGESYFREQEKIVLEEVSNQNSVIVATSGGIVLNPENVKKINDTGRVYYLAANEETLWKRVQDKKDRPLLLTENPVVVFSDIYKQRLSYYENSGGIKISTEGCTPQEVASKILHDLNKHLDKS